eukprot:TRINITY_DN1820_c0_g1_i9.p1 TRINITY_DN1820_c0_g1~~TRINITY_DN1820_c0_g1_i9.p1  ORF type:complete len:130 (-),score=5.35 TRINITY_DN1820_c0_g1_i9:69-458(-)
MHIINNFQNDSLRCTMLSARLADCCKTYGRSTKQIRSSLESGREGPCTSEYEAHEYCIQKRIDVQGTEALHPFEKFCTQDCAAFGSCIENQRNIYTDQSSLCEFTRASCLGCLSRHYLLSKGFSPSSLE